MKPPSALFLPLALAAGLALAAEPAPGAGSIEGTVNLESTGEPLHHVTVLLPQRNLTTETDDNGKFRFPNLPSGRYDVIAQTSGLTDTRRSIDVAGDTPVQVNFALKVSPIRQEITVTASGKAETTLESMNSVTTLDTLDLATKTGNSLGDVLDREAGVHKRSFGPGTSRPVLRGFDGDRVLIMQDGVRTGTLSSQSGDHGEPVDPQSLERVEIVRGPATLLYGSNAIGGVVNMITDHHYGQNESHDGVHGYLSSIGSTNNSMAGGSAGVSIGAGKWVFRMNTGGQHASDYSTARERIDNSAARTLSGGASVSRYGESGWLTLSYNTQRGTYKIPPIEEEIVQLPFTRQNVRLGGGYKQVNFSLNYSDWHHDEIADGEVGNQFFNKQFDYRGVYEQPRVGPLSGSFGVWGLRRDYKAIGDEAITPPILQNTFAVFGVESLQLERLKLQFGGRVETTGYNPESGNDRRFTGFSGSIGANVPLWNGGAFVTSYNHSYRAPALEEIYANGPHVGNLTYEIGDPNMRGEKNNGVDVSLRHVSNRIKGEMNWFYYDLRNFVFLAPTGEFNDGLIEARYSQAASRYTGVDGRVQFGLHPSLWLNLGFDAVDAQLKLGNIPLPRIPPVRGRIGLDFRKGNFSVSPELILAHKQDQVFETETPTAGYGTGTIRASYTLARQHALHLFSVNFFNVNNAYYRNHLSFIKDYAAEMGRGVSIGYSVRFF